MRAEPVDPRDIAWERDEVAYRVYFWRGAGASDEWRVTEADVTEVLDWARKEAQGRYITMWVEHTHNGDLGMIRLKGWEPTSSRPPPAWVKWARYPARVVEVGEETTYGMPFGQYLAVGVHFLHISLYAGAAEVVLR